MDIEVKRCYNSCPFFGSTIDGMECKHPFWDDKPSYDNMIITQNNSMGGIIPMKCPLRKEYLTINYKLKKIKLCQTDYQKQ